MALKIRPKIGFKSNLSVSCRKPFHQLQEWRTTEGRGNPGEFGVLCNKTKIQN